MSDDIFDFDIDAELAQAEEDKKKEEKRLRESAPENPNKEPIVQINPGALYDSNSLEGSWRAMQDSNPRLSIL